MNRRKFISRTGLVSLSLTLGPIGITLTSCGKESTFEYLLLDEFMPSQDLIGILGALNSENTINLDDVQELNRNELIAKIKEDYKKGNIMICDGWILSKQELLYLIQSISNS